MLTEVPEEENEDELLSQLHGLQESVKELNTKIARIERQFYVGADDQIFLAALLTFITIFLSLQYGDIATFFKSSHNSTAVYSAIVLEVTGIVFLGAAFGLRYWATLVDEKLNGFVVGRVIFWYNSSELRYGSLESLMTGFVLMVIILILNLVSIVPVLSVATSFLFLASFTIFVFGWVEIKILLLYKTKNLIPSNSTPFTQIVFSSTALFVSLMAVYFAIVNLFIILLSYQFSPFFVNPFANMTLFWMTSFWSHLQRMLAILLFTVGLFLFYKAFSRYKFLHLPSKETQIKNRLKRKRKKIFRTLVKRASIYLSRH